jgi:hypothetical protein
MALDYSKFKIDLPVEYPMEVKPVDSNTDTNPDTNPDPNLDDDEGFEQEIETEVNAEEKAFKAKTYKVILEELLSKENKTLPDNVELKTSSDLLSQIEELIVEDRANKKTISKFENAPTKVKRFLEVKDYYGEEEKAVDIIEAIASLEELEEDDFSNEAINKALYTDYLTMVSGLPKDEAENIVKKAIDTGDLDVEARKSKTKMLGHFKAKFDELKTNITTKQTAQVTSKKKELEDLIDSVDKMKDIGGIPITDALKKEFKKNLTTVVKVEGNKSYNDFGYKQAKHSKDVEKAIELYNTLGLFNFDKDGNFTPDLSKLSALVGKKFKSKLDELITEAQRSGKVGESSTAVGQVDIKSLGYNV